MPQPKVSRPHFPPGYLENPRTLLDWAPVESRLAAAKNYWLSSVRPNGCPHSVPKWGVWVARNPHVTVHLESGDDVVILEGTARAVEKPAAGLAARVARAYGEKYADANYTPAADQWDAGGLFEVCPRNVLAWTKFTDDPTKFEFE